MHDLKKQRGERSSRQKDVSQSICCHNNYNNILGHYLHPFHSLCYQQEVLSHSSMSQLQENLLYTDEYSMHPPNPSYEYHLWPNEGKLGESIKRILSKQISGIQIATVYL